MLIEQRPIDSITPYEKNPRCCNDQAVDAVAASIKEFGFRQPIVVDEQYVIIVGHTRWKAAKKLGMTEVPVHVAVGLTPEQSKAYRLADTWIEWGAQMLRGDLAEAEIPYVEDGPDGPLFADFHSLRHSYITALGRAGVDLRTAQELAGHSSPMLTARYSHRRLYDLAGAVEKLPSMISTTPQPHIYGGEKLKRTGTEA